MKIDILLVHDVIVRRVNRAHPTVPAEHFRPNAVALVLQRTVVLQSAERNRRIKRRVRKPGIELGRNKPAVASEKVLSAILEFKIREEQLEKIVRQLQPVLAEVNTVVSWGLASRFAKDGTLPVRARLEALGIPARPNAKINMGMGRPIVES